ncbi:hypothetical protein RB195_003637 [Necator americanus]|uniref:Uncharacterized protein n=1 Tax=Necator americanus TaxID=51031 RepID=A0ABR1DPQ5_NECAM
MISLTEKLNRKGPTRASCLTLLSTSNDEANPQSTKANLFIADGVFDDLMFDKAIQDDPLYDLVHCTQQE